MTSAADDSTTPSFSFKRRKTTHTKRARTNDAATQPGEQTHNAAPPADAPEDAQDETESVPNLKEILRNRNRKRPRDRPNDGARKPETSQTELVQVDAPRADQYTSRFIAQTGQVVDSSDAQMNTYVEARMAEQNYRKYGWPIPAHLLSTVAAIAPDLKHTSTGSPVQAEGVPATPAVDDNTDRSSRLAAGQGKLEEVVLSSDSTRTHKDWARLEGPPPAPKQRLGRDGKPLRSRKRRTSDALRRDALVDAVLRESKIEYFESATAQPRFAGTEDDMLEQFRSDYFESIEERQARKPAMPPSKDQPKGPKLGGSRSARAAMREREEAAAKGNVKR
ncbi:hypothetical protein C7974DRAFT_8370 [Boeremia exigua]|uniref:uncharacterized protein n=1 Tax=Boeremia exigua TaxID=749465 RepID=UPI001E8D8D5C|nr:uncharacterized protein C7974DRAFT_8370 [Boeremia exigua]KAH6643870.1 hypothetical protein C7974DRAFT_8370 [Boeremia exigua]